jgi:hypothetical protein
VVTVTAERGFLGILQHYCKRELPSVDPDAGVKAKSASQISRAFEKPVTTTLKPDVADWIAALTITGGSCWFTVTAGLLDRATATPAVAVAVKTIAPAYRACLRGKRRLRENRAGLAGGSLERYVAAAGTELDCCGMAVFDGA